MKCQATTHISKIRETNSCFPRATKFRIIWNFTFGIVPCPNSPIPKLERFACYVGGNNFYKRGYFTEPVYYS